MGMRCRVGNGMSIQIGIDSWLPDLHDPFIKSVLPDDIKTAKVSSLLKVDGFEWDEDVISDLFNDSEARTILSIPLSIRRIEDG